MSIQNKREEPAIASLLIEIGNYCPDFAVPGYWDMLEQNCNQWAKDITAGYFWEEVKRNLPQWRIEYQSKTKSNLLANPNLPIFIAKPKNSIINKLFRHHKKTKSLENIIPLHEKPIPIIGDIVRTRINCPYIDGVEFLATKLHSLSIKNGLNGKLEKQGKIQGYFAQHLNFHHEVNYREGGHGTLTKISCEIQIASTMATHMWEASHQLYEVIRSESIAPESWQWKPDDPRFISNQLGHMIHLADGLLVQLRDSMNSKKE